MVRKFLTVAACAGALLTGTSAFAADMTVSTFDWTGVYAGVNAGWAHLDPKRHPAGFIQPESSGFLAGARLGYNHQINSIVLGAEIDGNLTDISKTSPCNNPAFGCNAGSDWNGSIRARLGFAADRFMVFGTGGYAIADYNGFTLSPANVKFAGSKTLHGWVVGAGAEYAITDNILLNVEYDHMQFGTGSIQYDIPYPIRKPTIDQIKVGVSWKF
jgi:outer membrane immunogenic protein